MSGQPCSSRRALSRNACRAACQQIAPEPGAIRTLLADERGALGALALPLVLIVVAIVYAALGLGSTLLTREGMQDAADAAAYSAALFHARGMNLLSFLNLVMAALVAVLVAIRLAQALCTIAAAILAAAAWLSFGGTLALAGLATEKAIALGQAFDRAKSVIFPLLEGLHATERAVSVVIPSAASADALVEAARHHPPAEGAFALPTSTSLPVEPDEFPVLCEHGTEMVVDLALFPLPEDFRSLVSDAAGEVAGSLSAFLCGDGKGEVPSHTERLEQRYPRPPGLDSCERVPGGQACRQAERTLELAEPSATTGECAAGPRCKLTDPYEQQARQARRACQPRGDFAPSSFTWQEHEVSATFQFAGGAWQESEQTLRRPRLRTTERAPCGERGTVGRLWDSDSGPPESQPPEPLCTAELDELLPAAAAEGSTRQLTYRQVTRLFSCVAEVERTFPLAEREDAFGAEAGAEKRSPHRVEDELELGGEDFQLRAVAFGPTPGPGAAAGWVEAAPRAERASGAASLFAELGGLSVAQAEYYFDHEGDVPREEWLWDLRWTSRLRRFRLPTPEARGESDERRRSRDARAASDVRRYGGAENSGSPSAACTSAGAKECSRVDSSLELFDALVLH